MRKGLCAKKKDYTLESTLYLDNIIASSMYCQQIASLNFHKQLIYWLHF